ncbi:hypothetical protein FJZ36_08560 [Candidatus Poribacteria bacterium]|nr:hypothetical protein [Candidatus Poribacteria bacterium]
MKLGVVGAAASLAAALGCGGGSKAPVAASPAEAVQEVSFSAFIAPVLATKCVRCHTGERAADGVKLASYEEVIEHVVPGDADSSHLYEMISGPQPKMPKGSAALPERTQQLFRDWINQGAKNN